MKLDTIALFLSVLISLSISTFAEEKYYSIEMADLEMATPPENLDELFGIELSRYRFFSGQDFLTLRLPEEIEIYPMGSDVPEPGGERVKQGELTFAIRFPADPTASEGILELLSSSYGGDVQPVAIKIDPEKLAAITEDEFKNARSLHYTRLESSRRPGRAYFKHQANKGDTEQQGLERRNRSADEQLADTFSPFTGAMAMSENLALDRELILGRIKEEPDVPLTGIEGITVKAIDWKELMPEGEVKVDPLSLPIPIDQHALFLPSMRELFMLADIIEKAGAPVLRAFDSRNPHGDLPNRYLQAFGLSDRAALLKLPVKSIAITGGDPYFPSGTDVAILFECGDVEAATKALTAIADSKPGIFLEKFGPALALANSKTQLDHLRQTHAGKVESLGKSDEFKFFRHRYPIGAEGESAYLFLSDATIRRWGGPRMRIGASRRTRAMAALAELTSRRIDGEPVGDDFEPLLGKVTDGDGFTVSSANYGRLGAITPISELDLKTVTATENAAYEQWRERYSDGWSKVFDPIALRLSLSEGEHKLDLSVMPLTVSSEYRQFIDFTGDGWLRAAARKVHDSAVMFGSIAIERDGHGLTTLEGGLKEQMPDLSFRPLSWVGESMSLYLEDGFFWKALEHAAREGDGGDIEDMLGSGIPFGIRVESLSSVKLALFISAVKKLVTTEDPDMFSWTSRNHNGHSYSIFSTGDEFWMDFQAYYATTKSAFLFSLDEELLKRAMDREAASVPVAEGEVPEGRHGFFQTSPQFVERMTKMGDSDDGLDAARRDQSWIALPILNEWHRRKEGGDPVAQHAAAFATRIVCPGGKGYRWNEEAMTMESVAYGHPAAPRDDAEKVTLAGDFNHFHAGIDFEEDGLRLRATLAKRDEKPAAKPAPAPAGKQLATARELIPSKPGSVLRFKHSMTFDEEEPEKGIQTIEILKPEPGDVDTIRSKTFWKLGEEPAEEFDAVERFAGGGFGLMLHHSDSNRSEYSTPMMELPDVLNEGETTVFEFAFKSKWEAEGEDEEPQEENCIGEARIRVTGTETVKVAAGEFKDCVRVDSVKTTIFGSEAVTERSTTWYKKGVGAVKAIGVNMDSVFQAELTEYHIPKK